MADINDDDDINENVNTSSIDNNSVFNSNGNILTAHHHHHLHEETDTPLLVEVRKKNTHIFVVVDIVSILSCFLVYCKYKWINI